MTARGGTIKAESPRNAQSLLDGGPSQGENRGNYDPFRNGRPGATQPFRGLARGGATGSEEIVRINQESTVVNHFNCK